MPWPESCLFFFCFCFFYLSHAPSFALSNFCVLYFGKVKPHVWTLLHTFHGYAHTARWFLLPVLLTGHRTWESFKNIWMTGITMLVPIAIDAWCSMPKPDYIKDSQKHESQTYIHNFNTQWHKVPQIPLVFCQVTQEYL